MVAKDRHHYGSMIAVAQTERDDTVRALADPECKVARSQEELRIYLNRG